MSKKLISVMLIGLLMNFVLYTTTRANTSEKEMKYARKVKGEIAKLGTGNQSVIKVKLRDKTKLSGYVSDIGDDSFTVTDNNGKATQIPYSQVKKATGKNHLNGRKILIVLGFAWLIIIGIQMARTTGV